MTLGWVALSVLSVSLGPPVALGPPPVPAVASYQTFYAGLAAFDGGYVSVFEDHRASVAFTDVYAVRYDTAGARLDADAVRLTTNPREDWDPEIACEASQCLVVWCPDLSGIVAALFNPVTGVLGPERQISPATNESRPPAVASSPTGGYVVVYHQPDQVRSQRVDSLGVPQGAARVVASSATAYFENAIIVPGATNLLAAWVQRQGTTATVRSRLLDAQGVPAATAVSHGTTDFFIHSQDPAATWDGNQYAVLWSGSPPPDLFIQRVSAAGALVDATPLLLRDAPSDVLFPAIAFDGATYVVAWQEEAKAWVARFRSSDLTLVGTPTLLSADRRPERFKLVWTPGAPSGAVSFEPSYVPPERLKVALLRALTDGGLDATPDGGEPVARGMRSEARPVAAWTGTGFMVAWQDLGDDAVGLRLRPLSTAGVPLGSPSQARDAGYRARPAFTFNGERGHLVSRGGMDDYVDLFWEGVGPDGQSQQGPVVLTTTVSGGLEPAVIPGLPETLVVWGGSRASMTAQMYAVGIPGDGGLPELPATLALDRDQSVNAIAGARGAVPLVVWNQAGTELHWAAVSPQRTLVSEGSLALGYWTFDVDVASDGRDFLIAYQWGLPRAAVFAVRVTAESVLLDTPPLAVAPSRPENLNLDAPVAVAYDGHAYRVAYEVSSDAGIDLWWRRIWPDGGMDPPELLVGGPEDAEQVSLAGDGAGRLVISWREYDPAAKAARVRTMTWAELPQGAACTASAECRAGECVQGSCCAADAGPCVPVAPADGGAVPVGLDGGDGGPLRLRVGCSCSTFGQAFLLQLALLWLLGRRRRNPPTGVAPRPGAAAREAGSAGGLG